MQSSPARKAGARRPRSRPSETPRGAGFFLDEAVVRDVVSSLDKRRRSFEVFIAASEGGREGCLVAGRTGRRSEVAEEEVCLHVLVPARAGTAAAVAHCAVCR